MSRDDVFKYEQHLYAVLSGKRFLQMEGLGNEVPFFIYPYDPEDALEVAKSKKRIKNRLAQAAMVTAATIRSRIMILRSRNAMRKPFITFDWFGAGRVFCACR